MEMDDPHHDMDLVQLEEVSTIIVGDQEDLNGGDDDIEELEAGGQDHLGVGQVKKGPKIPLDHACKVCGSPASAYLHYGAIVCYSCRAFFRRAIRKHFVCRAGDYSCIMEGTRSNRCRGCRYQKCLQVGMKPEMVDAMLKRNPEGGKRRRKTEQTMSKVNTQPVFSRVVHDPLVINSRVELHDQSQGDVDGECQKFLVFNKSTQSFEPITIISIDENLSSSSANHLNINSSMPTTRQIISNPGIDMLIGEEGDIEEEIVGYNSEIISSGGNIHDSEDEQDDNRMMIIRAIDSHSSIEDFTSLPSSNQSRVANILQSVAPKSRSTVVSRPNGIVPQEWISNIVTDHEEVVQTCSHSPAQNQIISGTVVGTDLPGQVLSLPSELVVCNLSDTEVVQEEIIDTD